MENKIHPEYEDQNGVSNEELGDDSGFIDVSISSILGVIVRYRWKQEVFFTFLILNINNKAGILDKFIFQ